ncbi:LamB/YcsF family protein [Sulfoacidibacillus thermotolerans]|uniref:5-oxoprolinase subunit A n=1 Tax=Sulfoacidibacillus thermotolerans TaxID=1765684 RepID=A0A2U3DAU7_SULT2|nr:5-oxoprolinase subunit PxpA [Sulfoacidibacillus thermotolerans]PWI58407.1 lactam utilization protein LamB [Sulfoacidibacillus thermotolerans]
MDQIDMNCDYGEGFGVYRSGESPDLLNYVTSVNIACGFHAGDPRVMRQAVTLAKEKGVAIGAHPGLPDLAGFGRREMKISAQEVQELMIYQIGALDGFCRSEGISMQHVKPHGALYNMAARNAQLAEAIARAIYLVNDQLILFGLAGSELIHAGQQIGLRTASEAFADRTYQMDGSLTPRNQKDALIHEVEIAANQVLKIAKEGRVLSLQGTEVVLDAQTICIHGDGPHALEFAAAIQQKLKLAGISLAPVGQMIS